MSNTKPVQKIVAKAASRTAAESVPRSAKATPPVPASTAPLLAAPASKVKHKLVRDSFTIPKSEYLVLDALKTRATHLTRPVKKSELLRAGITALAAMSDRSFLAALNKVPSLKTGRPKALPTEPPAAKD